MPDGDFCACPPPAAAVSGRGGGAGCSQLTWLEGLPFFVFLVFVFLSAQDFSRPGYPRWCAGLFYGTDPGDMGLGTVGTGG